MRKSDQNAQHTWLQAVVPVSLRLPSLYVGPVYSLRTLAPLDKGGKRHANVTALPPHTFHIEYPR